MAKLSGKKMLVWWCCIGATKSFTLTINSHYRHLQQKIVMRGDEVFMVQRIGKYQLTGFMTL